MRVTRSQQAIRQSFSALLLALLPLLLLGGVQTHLGHDGRAAVTPVFADAIHAAETGHLEAADSVAVNRCLACLIPSQPVERTAAGAAGSVQPAGGTLRSSDETRLPDPDAGHSRRPRAPPHS